jgi:Phage head-tail joining protein
MNTGALRHRVTLDESGVPLEPPDWWCASVNEGGQATFSGRYHPGITTATRVHHKGRIYHVQSIANPEDRDAGLVLTCIEVFDGEAQP